MGKKGRIDPDAPFICCIGENVQERMRPLRLFL